MDVTQGANLHELLIIPIMVLVVHALILFDLLLHAEGWKVVVQAIVLEEFT